MMPAVRGVMAAFMSSILKSNVPGVQGTSTSLAPLCSIHVRYSGKKGVGTITSSPGLVMASMHIASAAAAPWVMYT